MTIIGMIAVACAWMFLATYGWVIIALIYWATPYIAISALLVIPAILIIQHTDKKKNSLTSQKL